MDVMDIRRNLLLSIFGGEPAMIGTLSQYYTTTFTRDIDTNDNGWVTIATVPFVPKIVVFSGGTDSDGHIINGVFNFTNKITDSGIDLYVGAGGYRNAANHNYVSGAFIGYMGETVPSSSAAKFGFETSTNKFYATRTGAHGWWRINDTFTFEFYG